VFDPGLGLIRAGFLFSRYGLRLSRGRERSRLNPRKNKRREKSRAG